MSQSSWKKILKSAAEIGVVVGKVKEYAILGPVGLIIDGLFELVFKTKRVRKRKNGDAKKASGKGDEPGPPPNETA